MARPGQPAATLACGPGSRAAPAPRAGAGRRHPSRRRACAGRHLSTRRRQRPSRASCSTPQPLPRRGGTGPGGGWCPSRRRGGGGGGPPSSPPRRRTSRPAPRRPGGPGPEGRLGRDGGARRTWRGAWRGVRRRRRRTRTRRGGSAAVPVPAPVPGRGRRRSRSRLGSRRSATRRSPRIRRGPGAAPARGCRAGTRTCWGEEGLNEAVCVEAVCVEAVCAVACGCCLWLLVRAVLVTGGPRPCGGSCAIP
jgi:hypothetical protein